MKHLALSALAAGAAIAAFAMPAQAAVLFDNNGLKLQDTNLGGQPVNLNSISADKKTVTGAWSGTTVTFTSTVDLDFNQGAATIFGADAKKGGLPDLFINLGAQGFDSVGFAFAGAKGSTFDLVVNGGTAISGIALPNGNTAFTLSGTGIKTLDFTFSPAFDTAKQFRLEGISTPAVPEPTSWALMIAGLGTVGFAMRRRKTAVSFA